MVLLVPPFGGNLELALAYIEYKILVVQITKLFLFFGWKLDCINSTFHQQSVIQIKTINMYKINL